jgi:Skp family chaperone for outer membrane proteins
MKIQTIIVSCIIATIFLFAGYQYSSAQPLGSAPTSKIGIVSVREVFNNCKARSSYVVDAMAEQKQLTAQIEKLRSEASVLEAGLKALKPGSPDYLAQFKEMWLKRGQAEAMQQFNTQQRALKEQRVTEDIYKEILRVTKELAKEKGLNLVLEKTEPEFPAPSMDEFVMMLNTHKVLYSDGCVDLTAEVTARLDQQEISIQNMMPQQDSDTN